MFVSDGKRTFDPDRHIELLTLNRGPEYHHFSLVSSEGDLKFHAEWSVQKVRPRFWATKSLNQNANNIVHWQIFANNTLPGFDEAQTIKIIREAFVSYETGHGGDSLNRHPPKDVVCSFAGGLRVHDR